MAMIDCKSHAGRTIIISQTFPMYFRVAYLKTHKKKEQNGTERKRKARKLENKLGKLVNAPGHESGI